MSGEDSMMRHSFTRRGFIGSGATALGATALTLSPGRLRAQTPVGLQLSWLHSAQFAGSYIALRRGWWSEAGLDVSLLPGGPNAAVEEGAPFRILGVAMQKNPFVIASLPANPVNEPADLEGKRIGMALANTPVLQALCTLNGVDINEIEIIPTQYSAQPLLADEVDCLLCWETDLPVAMAMQGVESLTMLMADHGYAVHSQTYIATEDSLANRRDELVALMAGEVRGWEAYREDTDAAAALTLEMFPDAGLDLETQELQAARQVPLMFSDLTDAFGFGWWTDETVA